MARSMRYLGLGALLGLVCPLTLRAQYDSELVGFNGPPIDDPETSQEMFQQPEYSGSTSEYIVANVEDYDNNAAFRAAGLQTEGDAAMYVFFEWIDETNPNAWLRLTTHDGPERPNPVLDTRGKVRFKITNRSELFYGDIGVCLGIRETGGADLAQLEDGGTTGVIEWVGVDGVMTDPNDPNHVTGPIPSITLPPSSDEYELEWDLATGAVTVDGTPYTGGFAGFTGNGDLSDAPDNRGTLEHIAITNVSGDPAVSIEFAIDELQFEATVPDPTPPPVIRAPVVEGDTEVEVECIDEATHAELFIDDSSAGIVTAVDGLATFTDLTLVVGQVLTATQTAYGNTSDLSAPVVVYEAGTALAENFDAYGSQDDLEALWTQTDPEAERKLLLGSGSASSCHNFVVSDYDPGDAVSRLYFSIGAVNGSDTEPLLVTYRFKHDSNDTNARARFELGTALSRAVGALGFAFSNGVGDAWGEQYTSMTLKTLDDDDDTIQGYEDDYFGYDYALTGIEREPGVWHKMRVEVLTDVVNFYIDDELANPVDPNTGTPLWPDGVPRVNDNDFTHVILGVGYSNNGPAMMYDDISVTLGDTEIPFGDPNPVDSPTIDGSLFPQDTSVNLSDIDPNDATAVTIYADGTEIGSASGPFASGTATVSVASLQDGETVTATQTTTLGESCDSAAVVVGVTAPTLDAVLVPGQTQVGVSDIEEDKASAVTVYKDLGEGNLQEIGALADPTEDPALVTTNPLEDGCAIYATQTVGGVEGPLSENVVVAVPAPTVLTPLDLGDTLVTVGDVHALAELVTVHVNEDTYTADPQGADTVEVTVPALEQGSAVWATQTIDGVVGPSSNTVLVGNYVTINELNYDDPSTDDLTFVELYNAGDDPIDIGGWEIQIGDYLEGDDPNWPGVYYRVQIPAETTIASHGFWTVGMTNVAAIEGAVVDLIDDDLDLQNGFNYAALRNANGVLLDAIAWETNKEIGTPTDPLNPEEIYTQIGLGIWGNHVNAADPPTSQSRYLDGLDTDENGRDVGIQPATPGFSNNQPDLMPYFENGDDGLDPLESVPNWVFSYKPLVAFDPNEVDSGGVGDVAINPSAIPYSPDGGLALIGWDEEGGGNVDYMGQLAKEDFTLEAYIYVAPELTPSGYEETKVGLRGSADGVHNFDWYNGATGVCWFLQRGSTWQTLYLLDENNGNDGDPGDAICATVLGTIDIGTEPSLTGWQRLLLEVKGDEVLGIFGGTYGNRDDGIQFVGTHDCPGPGGVYISYREAVSDNSTARPPSFDALSLVAPPTCVGDIDGDGDTDLADLAELLSAYGSSAGDPDYNAAADFDNDDDVDLADLAFLLGDYGCI